MKKTLYILICAMTTLSCNNLFKEKDTTISKSINEKKIDTIEKPKRRTLSIMTSSGNIEPTKDVILKGIKFKIVLNEKGDTTHWSTNDIKFKTPEGYSVENQLKDISKVEKDKIYKVMGFGYFIKLNSDWQLGFCEGKSCTDKAPTENSKVKWILKRN